MGIAFDAALVDAVFGSASGATTAFTVTGAAPALVVGVMVDDPQTVTGVTYHGAAMTPVDSQATGVGATLFVFALLAPAVGTHDIVASYSAPTTSRIAAGSWTGVTALDTSGKNSSGGANATSLAVTVTPTAARTWTVGLLVSAALMGTAGAATTQRGTTPSGLGVFDSNATQTPAAAVTLTLSSSSNKLSGIVLALAAPDDSGAAMLELFP